jgi:hypothetical protein
MKWLGRVASYAALVGLGALLGCVADDLPPLAGSGGAGGSDSSTTSSSTSGSGGSTACVLGSSVIGQCQLQ